MEFKNLIVFVSYIPCYLTLYQNKNKNAVKIIPSKFFPESKIDFFPDLLLFKYSFLEF